MPTTVGTLLIKIGSEFEDKGFDQAQKTIGGFDRVAAVGAAALASIGVAAIRAGQESVDAFRSFDAALNESLAIMGDVSDEMRGRMMDAALRVGETMTITATEAAESYFFLASAGLSASESVDALGTVAAFAQAGMFDMSRATDLATDAASALGLGVEDLARVTDVLVGANTLANASVEQFAEALTNRAAASAKAVGKDIEEVTAVLAALADQGVKGAVAGNQLSIAMRELQTRALESRDAMKEAGIEIFDATGAMNNMGVIVQQLESHLSGMTAEQKKAALAALGFADRTQGVLLQLLGTGDAIVEYEARLRSMQGITREVADKQLRSFDSQLKLLKNQLNVTAIAFGKTIVEGGRLGERVGVVRARFKDLTDWIRKNEKQIASVFDAAAEGAEEFVDALGDVADGMVKTSRLVLDVSASMIELVRRMPTVSFLNDISGEFDLMATALRAFKEASVDLFMALSTGGLSVLADLAEALGLFGKEVTDELEAVADTVEELAGSSDASLPALDALSSWVDEFRKSFRGGGGGDPEDDLEAWKAHVDALHESAEEIIKAFGKQGLVPVFEETAGVIEQEFIPLLAEGTFALDGLGAAWDKLGEKLRKPPPPPEIKKLFASKVADGLNLTADLFRDFTGTVQGLLAGAGPWGQALAAGLNLLDAWGLDVNKIFRQVADSLGDILSDVGDAIGGFVSDFGEFLGLGGGGGGGSLFDELLEDVVPKTLKAIEEMFKKIDRNAFLFDLVGREFDATGEKIAFLQEVFVQLADILPVDHELMQLLLDMLIKLQSGLSEAELAMQGVTGAIADNTGAIKEWEVAVVQSAETFHEVAESFLDDLRAINIERSRGPRNLEGGTRGGGEEEEEAPSAPGEPDVTIEVPEPETETIQIGEFDLDLDLNVAVDVNLRAGELHGLRVLLGSPQDDWLQAMTHAAAVVAGLPPTVPMPSAAPVAGVAQGATIGRGVPITNVYIGAHQLAPEFIEFMEN